MPQLPHLRTYATLVPADARGHSPPRAAPRPFDVNSWARGSPGGAPYKPEAGYSISPVNPYVSGGTPVGNTMIGLTSAMQGLGLTTAALRAAGIGRH